MSDRNAWIAPCLAVWSTLIAAASVVPVSSAAPGTDPVVVNAQALSGDALQSLQRLGIRAPPGRCWYDSISGA